MTELATLAAEARAGGLVVFSGAGLSTAAGIPDYRGPNGVWTRDPAAKDRARVRAYANDPGLRQATWQERLTSPLYHARPTLGHRVIDSMAAAGVVTGVVTQNVDGLHRLEGRHRAPLIELHGCIKEARCLGCGARVPMETALARVRAGELDPRCPPPCRGLLTSDTVTFGEPVPEERQERARQLILAAGTLLVVGSTLSVNPAARLVAFALEQGRMVAIVNLGPTRYDDRAHVRFEEDCQGLLVRLGALVGVSVDSQEAIQELSGDSKQPLLG